MTHSIEYVRDSFEKEGYILLSDFYINGKQKLNYICTNIHKHNITFYNWNAGYRCPTCAINKKRTKLSTIKKMLEKEEYILLAKNYTNNKQRLECICNKGHECTITWAGWNGRGDRCVTCGREQTALKQIGPGNSQWRGGTARAPYCYEWQNKDYKDYIKERDGRVCQSQLCNNDKDLVIHHIDYIKSKCNRENLITLCRGCNTIANTNRSWHTSYYRDLLHKKFNYEY